MAYEWVGVVATAGVGLAGITATWLLARANRADQVHLLQMEHEEARKAALQETKRKAYGEFSANLSILMLYLLDPQADLQEIQSSVRDLIRSLGEVELLGSETVRQLAPRITVGAIHLLLGTGMEGNKDRIIETIRGRTEEFFRLRRLMATDLGIPPLSPMEDIEKDIETLQYVEAMMYVKNHQHKHPADPSPPRAKGNTDGTLHDDP